MIAFSRANLTLLAWALTGLLCLGAVLYAAFSYGELRGKQERETSIVEHQETPVAPELIFERCQKEGGFQLIECALDGYREALSLDAESRNVNAQEQIANSTFWMLLVSTLTLIFFVLTTFYAKRTVEASLATSKAAQKMNRIVRLDQRPWLKIQLDVLDFSAFRDGTPSVHFSVRCKNVGRSPAIIKGEGFDIRRGHAPGISSKLPNWQELDRFLLPDHEIAAQRLFPYKGQFDFFSEGWEVALVFFSVSYTDISGEDQFYTQNAVFLVRESKDGVFTFHTVKALPVADAQSPQDLYERYI